MASNRQTQESHWLFLDYPPTLRLFPEGERKLQLNCVKLSFAKGSSSVGLLLLNHQSQPTQALKPLLLKALLLSGTPGFYTVRGLSWFLQKQTRRGDIGCRRISNKVPPGGTGKKRGRQVEKGVMKFRTRTPNMALRHPAYLKQELEKLAETGKCFCPCTPGSRR